LDKDKQFYFFIFKYVDDNCYALSLPLKDVGKWEDLINEISNFDQSMKIIDDETYKYINSGNTIIGWNDNIVLIITLPEFFGKDTKLVNRLASLFSLPKEGKITNNKEFINNVVKSDADITLWNQILRL